MKLRLVTRPVAEAEFDAAAGWYHAQRPALARQFVGEVRHVLDVIAGQPDRYPIANGDTREAPLVQFPYCIYYRVKPGRVIVVAVLHTSRDPAVWQARR